MSTTHPTALPARSLPTDETRPELRELIIRPTRGWSAIDWAELARSRELLYTFIQRDLKIRYKQTVLGVAWAVVQPLFTTIVYTVVFGGRMASTAEGPPYQVFVFAGLVPWTFFANFVAAAGLSLINQSHILTKVYFPRVYVPASTGGAFVIDLLIGLGILGVLMAFYRVPPSTDIVALPLLILLSIVAAGGLGLFCSAATLLFRDLRFVVPFALNLLQFLSPVIYDVETITRRLPERLQWLPGINPMFGIIAAYRSAIFGTPWHLDLLVTSTISSLVLLVFGVYVFRSTERYFVDIV